MKDRRRQQITSVIDRAVRDVLTRGVNDPRVRGIITVTSVEISPDLETARVGITVMPEEHENLTLHGLGSATKRIRKDVMDRVRLREMPKLEFYADRAIKDQAEVLRAIARATAELDETGGEDAPPEEERGTP
ncbi:MAG: 30S ribosome-binding factor RbfA [Planctomycetota bacterium]